MTLKKIVIIIGMISLIIVAVNCEPGNDVIGYKNDRQYPRTELANIPPPNTPDSLYYAVQTLSWKGVSQDGLIKGFWIEWKTYHLEFDDSTIQEPIYTTERTKTLSFPSMDKVNKQVFKVFAVDQAGLVDTVGAERIFYTAQVLSPETEILYPKDSATILVRDQKTSTWPGVQLFFIGDPLSPGESIKDYSVKVDDGEWSEWIVDTTYAIPPESFPSQLEGDHKVYVRSRNSAFVPDSIPAEINISLILPTHDKEWLVIDDTKDNTSGTEKGTDEEVDTFYESILEGVIHDNWDIAQSGSVPKNVLGQYRYVMYHSDDHRETKLYAESDALAEYLKTGGRLFLTGWNVLSAFDDVGSSDEIQMDDFISDLLHIAEANEISAAKMSGVVTTDEDTLITDLSKFYSFRDGMHKVYALDELRPFAEPMFYYDSAIDTSYSGLNGRVIGAGYYNSEYEVVTNGFPLFYLMLDDAKAVFNEVKQFFETPKYP